MPFPAIFAFLAGTTVGHIIVGLVVFLIAIILGFILTAIFPSLGGFLWGGALIVLSIFLPSDPFYQKKNVAGADLSLSLKSISAMLGIVLISVTLLGITLGSFINGLTGSIVPVGAVVDHSGLPVQPVQALPVLNIAIVVLGSILAFRLVERYVHKRK